MELFCRRYLYHTECMKSWFHITQNHTRVLFISLSLSLCLYLCLSLPNRHSCFHSHCPHAVKLSRQVSLKMKVVGCRVSYEVHSSCGEVGF